MADPPKLLDQVRGAIRARHYSRRTEEAYVFWIRRFILFYGKRHPREMDATHVTTFLTHLAVRDHVASSTQTQADVPSARTVHHVPVVLSGPDVRKVLSELSGVSRLVASLLYGAGLRLQECLELRVKDVDFERREITVRRGKGRKDRRVMLPESLRDALSEHLVLVKAQHERDVRSGVGRVVLPDALAR